MREMFVNHDFLIKNIGNKMFGWHIQIKEENILM